MTGDEEMGDLLQEFVNRKHPHLVGSFLVIMEVDFPEQPDDKGYHILHKGSPATKIGLAEYLRSHIGAIVLQEE